MFVFISPPALNSTWIPFEAGHAYARGIRVVPVGIGGVDLSRIPPPLSLLQGFNLSVAAAMNNMLAIINQVFDLQLRESLGDREFEQVFQQYEVRQESILGRFTHLVDELRFSVTTSREPDIEVIEECLGRYGIESHLDGRTLYSSGLDLPIHKGHCTIRVDPLLSAITFPALEELIPLLAEPSETDAFNFHISLALSVRAIDALHKLTARIFGTEVVAASGGRLQLGDLYLRLRQEYDIVGNTRIAIMDVTHRRPGRASIQCIFASPKLQEVPLERALETLFRVGALYVVGEGES